MREYYADLHVHVGRTEKGQPVKVAAAAGLTVRAVVAECLERKGIDLVGLVDCASPGVLEDLEDLVREGRAAPLPGGGLRVEGRLTILPAVELELACPAGGVAHFVGYLPTLEAARHISAFLSPRLTNVQLSSQRARLTLPEWLDAVEAEGGVVLPAHAFTPYRSVYGSCTRRLGELLSEGPARFGGLELGLSADTELADRLAELAELTFLSNSDAHSPARIAREYNLLALAEPSFAEVVLALRRQGGRRVAANYGLDPRLGKYYRTFCPRCGSLALLGRLKPVPFAAGRIVRGCWTG
ncbi:MAG: endonuclease Q family protein [Bacillota bacterium]|nr:endonuclease Q family protein [Bacillota bacterium]